MPLPESGAFKKVPSVNCEPGPLDLGSVYTILDTVDETEYYR
jgi:hypothetical protein